MAPDPISNAYFINPSNKSVCLYLHLYFVARQRLGKYVTEVTNTRNERRIVGKAIFYAVVVLWKERRQSVITRTSCYHFKPQTCEMDEISGNL
jgi:hypothetical protein